MTQFWAPDLDNAQNQRFVADFRERFGSYPSFYAAQSYDAIMLLKSAVEGTDGITVQEYKEISEAARGNPDLSAKIRQIYDQQAAN